MWSRVHKAIMCRNIKQMLDLVSLNVISYPPSFHLKSHHWNKWKMINFVDLCLTPDAQRLKPEARCLIPGARCPYHILRLLFYEKLMQLISNTFPDGIWTEHWKCFWLKTPSNGNTTTTCSAPCLLECKFYSEKFMMEHITYCR